MHELMSFLVTPNLGEIIHKADVVEKQTNISIVESALRHPDDKAAKKLPKMHLQDWDAFQACYSYK